MCAEGFFAQAFVSLLAPLHFLANERLLQPRCGVRRAEERAAPAIREDTPVIIAGFGRFGHVVGQLPRANGGGAPVLDLDSGRGDLLRRVGLPVFCGDATRLELLRCAGADKAQRQVLALDLVAERAERARHRYLGWDEDTDAAPDRCDADPPAAGSNGPRSPAAPVRSP